MRVVQLYKRVSSVLLAMFIAWSANGQVDRSIVPQPGPAPEISIDLQSPKVLKNGLKVIVVPSDRTPTVSVSLRLNYDPQFEGAKVGMIELFGDLWGAGTQLRSKAQLNEDVEFLGASWSTSSRGVRINGLSKHLEALLTIMNEVVTQPAFPEEEFEKLKRKTLSGLEAAENNPSAIAQNVRSKALYGPAHPYGEVMTPTTLGEVTLADCRDFYEQFVYPNGAYLVIIGDVKPKKALKLAQKFFGDWPMGMLPTNAYTLPEPRVNTSIAMADRPGSVQSVMSISNTFQMQPGHPDAIALTVANQVLGGGSSARLFKNLREDKAYTYGAYSKIDIDEHISTFTASANVRNAVTDSALAQFFYEIERMRTELVPQEELDAAINYLLGSFARGLESASTIAGFAINTDQYNLPATYYKEYLQRLKRVTPEDVLRVSKQYFGGRNALVTIVGAYDEIGASIAPYGTMDFYSNYAERVDEPSLPIPDSVNVSSVVQRYFDAMGGLETLKSIRRVDYNYTMNVQGQQLALNRTVELPGKSRQTISMTGFEIQKTVTDGVNAAVYQNGSPFPLSAEQKEAMIRDAQIFPELMWMESDFDGQLELSALKKTNDGNLAYIVHEQQANGQELFHYFDAESGLKTAQMSYEMSPEGEKVAQETRFSDFEMIRVNGVDVAVPHTIQVPMGPQTVTSKLIQVIFNGPATEGEFDIN